MEYTIFKICDGNIDLSKDNIHILLTDKNSSITLDDDTYWDVIGGRESLITNGLIYVESKPIEVKEDNKSKKNR